MDSQSYTVFDVGLDEWPVYIYDVNAGSSTQLDIECMLVPPEDDLMGAFFVLPDIEGLDTQTLTISDSMGESIAIVRNLLSSMEILSFQPRFVPELSGVYQCNTTFQNVNAPISVLITTGE